MIGAMKLTPDGFQLLLTLSDADDGAALPTRVEHHLGPREDLRSLFELAEDSPTALASYLHSGRVLIAVQGDHVVGHVQLTETELASEAEIKNMAVVRLLRFYQRMGFRMHSIEPDALTAATGYAPETSVDGIELRDRVWLHLRLARAPRCAT